MTLCLLLVAAALPASAVPAPTVPAFETVGPGMEFRQVALQRPRPLLMQQFRCDPAQVRFSLLLASDRKGKGRVARAEPIRSAFAQTAVINCSYFDEAERLLGYHERLGKVLVPQVNDGGVFGGFFFWDGRRAGIKGRDEARPKGVPVLFQAGPRLVWEGEPIPGLEGKALAARSGVSIDAQGRVTLWTMGVTSLTTLAELPPLLSAPVDQGGLSARRALNFDGGSSTQFSLVTKRRSSQVPGIAPVPAFLGVSPR